MDTAAKNMDTYVVTSGPLADAGHGLRSWTLGKEHERDRKVKKVKKTLVILKKKSKK